MRRIWSLLVVVGASAPACSGSSGGFDWSVWFADETLRARAVAVVSTIRRASCDGEVVAEFTSRSGEANGSGTPARVDPGSYALTARAYDADCALIAEGCVLVTLREGSNHGSVKLDAPAEVTPCCPSACVKGVCRSSCAADAGVDADVAVDVDAGVDADADADANVDADAGAGCDPGPDAWRMELIDPEGGGFVPSVTVGSGDNVHVSYYKGGGGSLWYARKDGSGWAVEQVDVTGNVGSSNDIAVESDATVHIVYRDNTQQSLRHAWRDGTEWHPESVPVDSAGDVGQGCALAIDGSDELHVSYRDDTAPAQLRYAYGNTGSWEIKPDIAPLYPQVFETAIAVDSEGTPHVAFLDSLPAAGIYWSYATRRSDTTWPPPDRRGRAPINPPAGVAIAVDVAGTIHMLFQDNGLMLRWWHKTGEDAWIESLRVGNTNRNRILPSVALAFDRCGEGHVAYVETPPEGGVLGSVHYEHLVNDGTWNWQADLLDGVTVEASTVDIAVSPTTGAVHIVAAGSTSGFVHVW